MVVCANCFHKRSFHKKIDGNAWCSVQLCACKEFVEAAVPFNRRQLHAEIDKLLDDSIRGEPPEQ